MNAIIFGINGQDGFYLDILLKSLKVEIIGISRNDMDISNYNEVSELVKKQQPNYIFHLAANSTTNHNALFENHETISTGTLNILEAVKNFSTTSKVFISGSGLQFVNNNSPIKESDLFEARDAYSIARIQSVYAARYYRNKHNIKTYVGYFYNHDSPRRPLRHMAQKIAQFALEVKNGSASKLEIGDIKTRKEWTFAADVVDAIWTFINQNTIFEANISSGLGYTIEDWLNECFKNIGKNWQDYIELKEGFIADYNQLVSDNTLITSLGWKPKVSFHQLSKIMMEE